MTWEIVGWLLALAMLVFVGLHALAFGYGYERARETGATRWRAVQEGCATATGNSYIVHRCDLEPLEPQEPMNPT